MERHGTHWRFKHKGERLTLGEVLGPWADELPEDEARAAIASWKKGRRAGGQSGSKASAPAQGWTIAEAFYEGQLFAAGLRAKNGAKQQEDRLRKNNALLALMDPGAHPDSPLRHSMLIEQVPFEALCDFARWRMHVGQYEGRSSSKRVLPETAMKDLHNIGGNLAHACRIVDTKGEHVGPEGRPWAELRAKIKRVIATLAMKKSDAKTAYLEPDELLDMLDAIDFKAHSNKDYRFTLGDLLAVQCFTGMDLSELVSCTPRQHFVKLVEQPSKRGNMRVRLLGWEQRDQWAAHKGFLGFEMGLSRKERARWREHQDGPQSGKREERGFRGVAICSYWVSERVQRLALQDGVNPDQPFFRRSGSTYSKAIKRALGRTLIEDGRRSMDELSSKCFRRTFKNWGDYAGASNESLRKQMGHTAKDTHERAYGASTPRESYALAESIDAWFTAEFPTHTNRFGPEMGPAKRLKLVESL